METYAATQGNLAQWRLFYIEAIIGSRCCIDFGGMSTE